MRYFRNPNFISFCFLILIKPGCISGIPALGILDTLLNMIRIMLVLFTLIVLFKNAQLLPVNRLFGVTMLVVASILWEPISTLTGGGSIADFGALMNDFMVVGQQPRWKVPYYLVRMMMKQILNFPFTEHVLCDKVTVSSPGMHVEVDGEIIACEHAEFTMHPGALMLYW